LPGIAILGIVLVFTVERASVKSEFGFLTSRKHMQGAQLRLKMHHAVHEGEVRPEGTSLSMAERGGFDPLNAEPCAVLHGLLRTKETKRLSGFRLPLDLISLFSGLIRRKNVAQPDKM
jgi:hypothetical protein